MRFGIALAHLHTSQWVEASVLADELGYESVWTPDHLVFPLDMAGELYADGSAPPVPPSTPLHDYPALLCFIAARTTRIRLGTFVYLFGLRHPFVATRAFTTLDVVSGGRAEIGVGAGWLAAEMTATLGGDPGAAFAARGRRLDEALTIAKRLWTEDVVDHDGEFWQFGPVMFEPKPVQRPHPPVLVGGESPAALRRAARHDGWMSMPHTFETATVQIKALRRHRLDAIDAGVADGVAAPARPFSVTVCTLDPMVGPDAIARWAELGVDRLVVRPWSRTRDALDGLRRFRDGSGDWFATREG